MFRFLKRRPVVRAEELTIIKHSLEIVRASFTEAIQGSDQRR
jgi:hypothetical protein